MDTVISWSQYGLQTVTEIYQRATNPQKPIPNLHALVIGIDNYPNVSQLSGAVADADSFDAFLRTDLGIPPAQITSLRNDKATRSAIIDAFNALRDSAAIKPLDPIVVYYAGHGSEVDTPNGRKGNGSKAQCVVPWDVGMPDDSGSVVYPIPDYTTAALLYNIAEAKGNNITVIFDCCHSASSTRGVLNTYRLPLSGALTFPTLRSVNFTSMAIPPPRPPVDLTSSGPDRVRYAAPSSLPPLGISIAEPSLSRTTFTSRKSFQPGMQSHVLLAACGHAELAYERTNSKNGYFTSTLLQVLRSGRIDELTYKSCMENFPRLVTPRPQNPVCEGDNVNRLFFNASIPGAHRSFIPVIETEKGYVLKAGFAQGVLTGFNFSLHDDDIFGPENPSLGMMVVTPDPDKPSRSRCEMDQATANVLSTMGSIYARFVRPAIVLSFNVMITDAVRQSFRDPDALYVVTSRDQAKVVLDLDQTGHVTFEILDPDLNALGVRVLPRTVLPNPKMIKHVLDAMALWNSHLLRVPTARPRFTTARPFAKRVSVELYRLQIDEDDHLGPVGENLNDNGLATIDVSPKDMFGLKITNASSRRLYAYLFFFSTVKQSIHPLFLRVFGSASVDPPLDAGGQLTLGYDSDDLNPLSFHLRQTPLDVGVFRLFVTTSPAEFDAVAQPSPFSALNSVGVGGDEFVDSVCFECSGASKDEHVHDGSIATGMGEPGLDLPDIGNVKPEPEPLVGPPLFAPEVEPTAQVLDPESAQPPPEQRLDPDEETPDAPPVARMMVDVKKEVIVVDPLDLWDVIDIRIVLRNPDI